MSNKEPEVTKIPDKRTFANDLVESFLVEEGIMLEVEEGADPLSVILSVPDLHVDFTLWLCDLLREGSYEELASPKNTILN